MAWYDVLLRRSIIQDVILKIEATSRVQARKDAEARGRSEKLNWQGDGTVDEQPYSVSETKIKTSRGKNKKPPGMSPERMLVIKSCAQCYMSNSNTLICEHPILVKKFPVNERNIDEKGYFLKVLPDCPLGEML